MNITDHAAERARERLNIPRKSAARIAIRAYTCGVRREDTAGSLRRYLDTLFFRHCDADNIRVYAYYVYIFSGEALITVFALPQKYKATVDKIAGRNHHA